MIKSQGRENISKRFSGSAKGSEKRVGGVGTNMMMHGDDAAFQPGLKHGVRCTIKKSTRAIHFLY